MVPASALILFNPTVAPASPCRVPREVKEFMAAPAVELGVEAATEKQRKGERKHKVRGVWNGKKPVVTNRLPVVSLRSVFLFSLQVFL